MSEASKETIQVPIPSPPEGWVFDGYRTGNAGEMIFANGTWSLLSVGSHYLYFVGSHYLYFVAVKVPPPWTPSISFKPGWIARDDNGGAHWYENEPERWCGVMGKWVPGKGDVDSLHSLNIDWPDVPASQSLTKVG